MIYVDGIWIFLCGGPGRILCGVWCQHSFVIYGSTRVQSLSRMRGHAKPLERQISRQQGDVRCDVVAPDLTDFMQLGPLSPWSPREKC